MMYQYFSINEFLLVFLLLNYFKKNKKRQYRNSDDYLYVALGDSITNGLGCILFHGFSHRIYESLRRKICNSAYDNLGKAGLTSSGLLCQLKGSQSVRDTLKKADIVTITIGGNNLMKSASNNYKCINKKLASKGIIQFKKDWPEILHILRCVIGTEAKIIVMNIYNPYKVNDRNYKIANYFIDKMNEEIEQEELMQEYCYSVVDAYSCFEKDKTLTCFYSIIRDPHPNNEGHKVIAKQFEQAIEMCTSYI